MASQMRAAVKSLSTAWASEDFTLPADQEIFTFYAYDMSLCPKMFFSGSPSSADAPVDPSLY